MSYSVELSKNQLKVIEESCDLRARIELGQWDRIVDYLPIKNDVDHQQLHNDLYVIAEILSRHLKNGINGMQSSLGVGNKQLPESNGIAFDIKDTIRHKLSWENAVENNVIESENSERKFPEMLGVNYDRPFKWGSENLPIIKKV